MKFCFKLQKSAKETHEMLKLVYGDAAVTRKTVYKWFERFRGGCESVEDERSGRPSTSKTQENVERVSEIIRSNRQLTIRKISEDLNISYGSVQSILTTDLNMRQVTAKFVPPILTEEQKQQRLSISLELLERSASDSDFLRYIITGDETWVYGYDPETKVQGSQWKSPSAPRAKKARQSGSSIKVMLIVFFWPWWNCPSWVRTSEHNSELWILQGLVRAFDQRCVCETAWEMGQWFHPAPQQCTLPHVTPGTAVSVWREHYRVSSPAVFLRPGAVWLLALPQSQSGHERQTLWIDSGHQGSCDSTAGHTHEGGLPALLCRVARAVGQVCSEWGGVFWGGLVAVCLSVINWF